MEGVCLTTHELLGVCVGVPLLGCLMVKVCLKTGQDVTLRVLNFFYSVSVA